ncbi:hypothetical protein GGI09_000511 [Coemansia sp. S100]|nr:hypothetical protein LPJ71_000083 [Coemansia sp. S17]KAJ2103737.1 hypothetical protein GGI09_000511 [Coemansia sp. S100]
MPKTRSTLSRKKSQKPSKPQKPCMLHIASTSAAEVPSDVLQLITDYLSPTRCASQLSNHVHVLQRLAGVNRRWRAVAMPQLYQTVVIDIDEPTKKQSTHGEGNKLWTNIDLFTGTDLVRMAREVWITVRGSGQTSLLLAQRLRSAGLRKTVWPGVERLHFDTSKCSFKGLRWIFPSSCERALAALNRVLSAALPSLREISFLGPGAHMVYNRIPISQLINARLGGPQPLRVLRITSDIHLDFARRLSQLSTPIELTCLDINTIEITEGAPLLLPPLLASTLVELRLGSIYVKKLWEPFIAPPSSSLVFSSLKSLTLCFTLGREIQPRHSNTIKFAMDSEDEDWWEEDDDGHHGLSEMDPDPETSAPGYMASAKFGTPKFPVLTSLEIRRFPRSLTQFLLLFESSPITTLSLWSLKHRIPEDLDLSPFRELRNFSVRFLDVIDGADEELIDNSLSSIITTVNPRLQALTLMMHTYDPFKLELDALSFADNLTSLTFEGHIVLGHAVSLLPLLSNLQRLNIFASVTDSVPAAVFKREYKQKIAPHLLPPLSTSLRCVQAEHLQKLAKEERWTITTHIPRNAAEEVSLYRHLILYLVCRVSSLDTLMVSAASLEGVKKSINTLAKPGIGPEHLSRIRCVEIPVVDEFYFELDGE